MAKASPVILALLCLQQAAASVLDGVTVTLATYSDSACTTQTSSNMNTTMHESTYSENRCTSTTITYTGGQAAEITTKAYVACPDDAKAEDNQLTLLVYNPGETDCTVTTQGNPQAIEKFSAANAAILKAGGCAASNKSSTEYFQFSGSAASQLSSFCGGVPSTNTATTNTDSASASTSGNSSGNTTAAPKSTSSNTRLQQYLPSSVFALFLSAAAGLSLF